MSKLLLSFAQERESRAPCNLRTLLVRQPRCIRYGLHRVFVTHVKGGVGSEKDVFRSDEIRQIGQRFWLENNAVEIEPAQQVKGRGLRLRARLATHLVTVGEASDLIGRESTTMR